MWACHATSRGAGRLSTLPFGKTRSKAGAWCGGSTSKATAQGTWLATAARSAPASSIRSTPIAIARSEARRVGTELYSKCRLRGVSQHYKKTHTDHSTTYKKH